MVHHREGYKHPTLKAFAAEKEETSSHCPLAGAEGNWTATVVWPNCVGPGPIVRPGRSPTTLLGFQ